MNKVHRGPKALFLFLLLFSSLTSIFSQALNFDLQLSGNVFEYVVPCGEMKIDLSICNNTISEYDPEDPNNIIQQVLVDVVVDAGGNLEVVNSPILMLENPNDNTSRLQKSYTFFPLIGYQEGNPDGYTDAEIFPCLAYPLVYKRINPGTFYVTVTCTTTAILSNGQTLTQTYTKTLLLPEVIAMVEVSGKLSELQTIDSKHPNGYPLYQTAYAQSNPQYIKVIGELEIDADYMFWEGTKILLDDNARIVVKQNKSLELANVNLFGCGTKWDKIAVENNAKLISYFSKMRDAKNAIFVDDGGAAYLFTNDFSFNENCVYVGGPTANVVSTSNKFYGSNLSTQFPAQLVKLGIKAKFTDYSSNYSNFHTGISATAGGNYVYVEGISMHTNIASSKGIDIGWLKSFGVNTLNVVNSDIRSLTTATNDFSIAVRPFNTNVKISNSFIGGTYGVWVSNCPTVAIAANSIIYGDIVGFNADKYNFGGDAASSTSLDLQYATFRGNKAISLSEINFVPRGKIMHCDGANIIRGRENAINVVNCVGLGLLIQNNQIEVLSEENKPLNAINVIGSRSIAIKQNNIVANELFEEFPIATLYNIGMGINIEGGFSNSAQCNTVRSCDDPNVTGGLGNGAAANAIVFKQSSNGNLEKNEIFSALGLRMSGMCTVFENKIQGNYFEPCTSASAEQALAYDNSAIVGEQKFRQNFFYSQNGVHANPLTYSVNRYIVDNSDPLFLTYILLNPQPVQWFVLQTPTMSDLVYSNAQLCPNGIGNVGLIGKVDKQIMRGQVTSVPFPEAANWIGQRQLYRHLSSNTVIDAVADSFMFANNSSSIGKLHQIESKIDEALLADAANFAQLLNLETSYQAKTAEIRAIDQIVGVPNQIAAPVLNLRQAKILDLVSLENQMSILLSSTAANYTTKIAEARTLLAAFNPSTPLETNEKAFWNFHLNKNEPNTYSIAEKAVIAQLASQCSQEGGEPVLKARAIYREIFGEMPYYDEELCNPISPRQLTNQLKSSYGMIYPNPASDEIRIALSDPNFAGTITLHNSLLQEVYAQTIASNHCIISVSRLDSGVYTLSILGKNGTEAHKIVVLK